MKMFPGLVCSVVLVVQGFAQSGPATQAPGSDATTAPEIKTVPEPKTKAPPVRITPPAPKTAGEAAAAKKAADAAKKAEPAKKEEPKIEGVVVSRGEKGFMGVEIVGGAFKITFYDAKRKKITPDVARAALRWDAKYKVGQERVVLNPGADGKSLSNPKTIRPPYSFKLFITLLKEASDDEQPVGETHVIDFRA